MKPKYRAITRALPAAVSIALSIPFAAQAAIFADDTAGNAQPTTADNGANTIRANGGTSSNPFVNILSGVSMSGDAAETEVVEITVANYTVTNAGILSGTNHNGIFSSADFTLTNSGTIAGGTAGGRRGILTVGGTTSLTNLASGLITGTDDGIHFTTNGGVVTNYGTISGTTGSVSDGIRGRSDLTVHNMGGGTISGVQYGIYADANAAVTNHNGASITATNEDAIHLTADGGVITNRGTITATGGASSDGIRGRNNLTVNNLTHFGIYSTPVSGGSITGSQYGVYADDNLLLSNENLASITGTVSGIRAGDGATISNYAGGTISGTNDAGIRADDDADIFNGGTITGGVYGINLGTTTTAVVSNQYGGLISGADFGILGDAGVETITNAGTITGGLAALQLNGGANVVNLNDGSVVNGNVRASGGSLAVTMNGGLTSTGDATQNIINGGVFDALTLNKTGSGLAVVTGVTNADSISVTGGYLYLRSAVTNATGGENTISANGASIGGLGIWDSTITLTNGATISPGSNPLALTNTVSSSIGTLTVTGDVTLSASSAYIWNATPGGASDRIVLTGAGDVFTTNGSAFVISPTHVNRPLLDGSTVVVDTAATLSGSFDSIQVGTFPSTTPDTGLFQANQIDPILAGYFTTLTKVNGSQDWELTISHDYSLFGTTPNEIAAGEMLNGLVSTSTGDVADLLAAMDYSDETVTQGVLAALDPGAYMAATAALVSNNYQLHRVVENHNAAVRAGAMTGTFSGGGSSGKGGVPAPVSSGCSGNTNVWGSFAYDWQELNTGSSSFDQDGEVYYFNAGIDFTVAENFRLGLVAEGSRSDMDGDLDLGSEVDSYRFAAYANWGGACGWFADALIGYNTHDIDQSRSTFMARAAVESASYDADGWQGLINAGYAFETSVGTFAPYLGLEWQQLSADSFETSGGPLPISVDGYDVDSFRALAGVRWEAALTDTIKGYASAAYAFEFEDDAAETTVSFGGGSYRALGLELGDAVMVSAGIRWGIYTCTTLDVGYRGEFAMDDGVDSNGANIGLNYSF